MKEQLETLVTLYKSEIVTDISKTELMRKEDVFSKGILMYKIGILTEVVQQLEGLIGTEE